MLDDLRQSGMPILKNMRWGIFKMSKVNETLDDIRKDLSDLISVLKVPVSTSESGISVKSYKQAAEVASMKLGILWKSSEQIKKEYSDK
jgi:hypothetical protein